MRQFGAHPPPLRRAETFNTPLEMRGDGYLYVLHRPGGAFNTPLEMRTLIEYYGPGIEYLTFNTPLEMLICNACYYSSLSTSKHFQYSIGDARCT